MKKKTLFQKLWLFIVSALIIGNFSSCKDEEESNGNGSVSENERTCIILNQGNFNEANGSISVIDKNGEITNQVYKTANGHHLAAIIESGFIDRGKMFIICNNEDKVEALNLSDFKRLFTIKGIITPRYGTVADGYLFVTSVPDWYTPEGRVYKVDIAAAEIDTFIELNGQPEGITTLNGKIVVGEGNKVKLINPTTLAVEKTVKVPSALNVKHFTKDADNNIWASLSGYDENYNAFGGITRLDFSKDSVDNYTQLDNFAGEGHLSVNPSKTAILYRTISGAYTENEKSGIGSYDIATQSVKEIVEGDGFYGFNVDPKSGDIYTANINGWITNSTLLIYDAQGNAKSTDETVGVGACRFIFQ